MITKNAPSSRPVAFVDSIGGGLAALAAAVAHSLGRTDAIAATSSDTIDLPTEVATVLDEVGMKLPPVVHLASVNRDAIELTDLALWSLSLSRGHDDFERCVFARVARDRIERRLTAENSDLTSARLH